MVNLTTVRLVLRGYTMGTFWKMWAALICMGLAVCVAQAAEMNLPQDTSVRLAVRELRISGNRLISTDRLLEYMPEPRV